MDLKEARRLRELERENGELKKLAEFHGGIIAVESILDKGSVFTLHLPVAAKLPVEQGHLEAQAAQLAACRALVTNLDKGLFVADAGHEGSFVPDPELLQKRLQ
jgi:hypothetical protein